MTKDRSISGELETVIPQMGSAGGANRLRLGICNLIGAGFPTWVPGLLVN